MAMRPPRRAFAHCECGDHAFASLTQGFVTLVSPDDVATVGDRNWNAFSSTGSVYYAQRHASVGGKKHHIYMHRAILGLT